MLQIIIELHRKLYENNFFHFDDGNHKQANFLSTSNMEQLQTAQKRMVGKTEKHINVKVLDLWLMNRLIYFNFLVGEDENFPRRSKKIDNQRDCLPGLN